MPARRSLLPRRLRRTFATKLLVAGLLLSLTMIGAVSAFLLISTDRQQHALAQSTAQNRAELLRQLVQNFAALQTADTAVNLAKLPALADRVASGRGDASGGGQPLTSIIAASRDQQVAVLAASEGGHGRVLYPTSSNGGPVITDAMVSVRTVLSVPGVTCGAAPGQTGVSCGVEIVSGVPLYAVAAAVHDSNGKVIGAVVYTTPLTVELERFANPVGYPAVFIPQGGDQMQRVANDAAANVAIPAGVRASLQGNETVLSYAGPDGSDQAVGVVPIAAPSSSADQSAAPAVAGYFGVEVSLAPYLQSIRSSEIEIGGLALTAILLTALLVFSFVHRNVRRPVGVLQAGVHRIAGGDYSTDVAVLSEDEIGDLARGVNVMRAQIQSSIARINASVRQLGDVSRALTTTTTGVDTLEEAVVSAAAAIAGRGATVRLLLREGDELRVVAGGDDPGIDDVEGREILAGNNVRRTPAGQPAVLAVPMFLRGDPVGALVARSDHALSEMDERALMVLANNAAIAVENTRLFEQEKQTVQRLRELDSLKSDFLSTVQHEMRTPIMAIMGQIELINAGWGAFDEAMQLQLLKEMGTYTGQLQEIVETMIDFSLLSAESINLKPAPTMVEPMIGGIVQVLTDRYQGTLPVEFTATLTPDLCLRADPQRSKQVIQSLLDNAVKFTPKGGHVRLHGSLDGDTATLVIEDDGIGIGEDALPRVFEPFFQEDNSKTRTYGGMGMGLALAQRLITAHGGTIAIASTRGQGTTVTVTWPAADPAERPAEGGFHVATGGFQTFS